jgi:hypothetical protein
MKMRFFALLGVVAVFALCGQQTAHAGLTVGDTVELGLDSCSFGNGAVDGGEFTIDDTTNGYKSTTFCASILMEMNTGTPYKITSLGLSPETPAFNVSTPWGKEATYIFNQYVANAAVATSPASSSWTAGYVPGTTLMNAYASTGQYTSPSTTIPNSGGLSGYQIAGAMQYVFWQALNMDPGTDGLGSDWASAYTLVNGKLNWSGNAASTPLYSLDDVNQITISDSQGNVQPQLWLTETSVPAGSGGTPEPASLVIWSVIGAGAAGFAMRRRRAGRWSADNRHAIFQVIEGKR